jgi:hypothetical protein
MALSSSNISPTCKSERGRCSIRSANLGPGLARPPAPGRGLFPSGCIAIGNGSDEQMFGAG